MGKLELIDADTLYYTAIDHPKMLIDGLLSTGLAVLSGDSKIGKSWMVLWFCLQIASGEPIWGIPTTKTDVVYLALEDRSWRLLCFGYSFSSKSDNQIPKIVSDIPQYR